MGKMISNADIIQMVINSLEGIEVHGKDNMSKLLGCVYALEEIIKKAEQTPKEDGEEVNAE